LDNCSFFVIIKMMSRHKGLDFKKKRKKKISSGVFREILSYLFWIGISAVMAVVLMYAFGLRTNVIGNSMEPGLYGGQQIMMDRLIYQVSEPQRGDVIAFIPNGNEESHYYIKRVVAVPGETIVIKDGVIYIDGSPIIEGNYDKIKDPGIAESEIYLNDDEYFVLGDNRNFSEDSRSGNIGVVNKSYIIGKVWFKLSRNLEYIGFVK